MQEGDRLNSFHSIAQLEDSWLNWKREMEVVFGDRGVRSEAETKLYGRVLMSY